MDLQALHDELVNDPQGMDYQPHIDAGNINALRDLLEQDDPAGQTFRRTSIPMSEIYAQVDWVGEYIALTGPKKDGFKQITSTPNLDASSQNIVSAFEAIFGSGSTTWSNLEGIVDRKASRAEAVLGEGEQVTHDDIVAALRL